jgi:hypothetical protein
MRPEPGGRARMNKVAKTTWLAVAILAAIILAAMLLTRGGA